MMIGEMGSFVVYGFGSTHEALDAEALLDDMGVEVVPVPAPAAISAKCGIALRVPETEAARADKYLENAGLEPGARVVIQDL